MCADILPYTTEFVKMLDLIYSDPVKGASDWHNNENSFLNSLHSPSPLGPYFLCLFVIWQPLTCDSPKRQKRVNKLFGHCLILKKFFLFLQLYDKKRLLSRLTTIKNYILKLFFFDGSMTLFFNLQCPGSWKYIKFSDNMKTTKVLEVSYETLEACSIFYPKEIISEYLFGL